MARRKRRALLLIPGLLTAGLVFAAVLGRSPSEGTRKSQAVPQANLRIQDKNLPDVPSRVQTVGPSPESRFTSHNPRSVASQPAGSRQDLNIGALLRRALHEKDPKVWRPALFALARMGTPRTHAALAQAMSDPRNHVRASDATGALARFPSAGAVDELHGLLRNGSTRLARIRALQGLVLMIRWTPKGKSDAALLRARNILLTEGLLEANQIEKSSKVAAFRHHARQVQSEIENLRP